MMTRMVGLFPRDAFFHVHDGRYGDDEDGLLYGRGSVVCVVVKLGNRQEFAVEVVPSLVTSFSACDVWLVAC